MRLMFCFLSVFSLCSCSERQSVTVCSEPEKFKNFPTEENVNSTKVKEFLNGDLRSMYYIDSTIILFSRDKGSDFFFYNYSLKHNKFSTGYLRKGKGPNESIGGFCAGLCEDNLWVYDLTLKKILFTKVDSCLALSNRNVPVFTYTEFEKYFYKITVLDKENLLTTGYEGSEHKIRKVNLKSEGKDSEFGIYSGSIKDFPMDGIADAFQAFIYSKPTGDKVVLAYRFTDVVELYDIHNESKIRTMQGPDLFDVDFKIKKRGAWHYFLKNTQTRKAFIAGTVTDQYIYLAYSGQVRSDGDWNSAVNIHIYDWKGNPIRRLTLDVGISALTVSPNDNTLFAYDDKTGYLVKVDLK